MDDIEIHVGPSLREAAADVARAWKDAESGHVRPATDRISVPDWTTLHAVLTPQRHDLLRHLRGFPAESVSALARELGRDAVRVSADVEALRGLGLVTRAEDGRLSSPFDAITSTIHLAA